MSETTVERPVADLATLQKELEQLAARGKPADRMAGERREIAESMPVTWGK